MIILYKSTKSGYLRIKIRGESPFMTIATKDLKDFLKIYKDLYNIKTLEIVDRTAL